MAMKKVPKINYTDKYENKDKRYNSTNDENITNTIDNTQNAEVASNNISETSIKVERVNRNIDTDQYSAILKYIFKGTEHKLEVKRASYLRRREIIKLQDYGLEVTEYNADKIIKHLEYEEMNAPMTWVHSNVGFDIFDGKYVFKHYSGVNVASSYNGKLDIIPKGTYGGWYNTVIDNVIGNIPLEAMLVIGFSSAVVGLLSLIANYDSLLAHLSGDSTTGKTTASMLAISIWGNPSTKITDGLASTWNTTENAMFNNIINNHGLTVCFDEVSMNDSLDFTKFIYKFTGNKDKGRLNKESKADDTGTWGSTFISNGEFSLLEKAKKNTGAQLRIIDFYNIKWTKDAKSADAIQETILQNYGHVGTDFVRHLLKYDVVKIYDEIKELREHTIEQMKEKGFVDKYVPRRSWKYTILMYTAIKVNEFLSIPFHIDEIWDFLMENEKQSINNRDLQRNAFEYFLEQVNINYKKFLRSDSSEATSDDDVKNPTNDIMGKINVLANKNYNEICIFPDLFRKIMKDGGFEDPKIILKSWKEQGMLDCEADRFTRKRTIIENGGAIPVHIIRVNKDGFFGEHENDNSQ